MFMWYKLINKSCAGKTAAAHRNCVTQSRALSSMAGQCHSPSYPILIVAVPCTSSSVYPGSSSVAEVSLFRHSLS